MLTREKFFQIATGKGDTPESEAYKRPEVRAQIAAALERDRQWIAERLRLTEGDGFDTERVCMELYELTGIDVLTLMQMPAADVRRLVDAAIRKRSGGLTVALTDNDRSVLVAMLELEATPRKPESAGMIIRAALGRGDAKKAFNRLKSAGLVDSKGGRSGGYWLTKSGQTEAKLV